MEALQPAPGAKTLFLIKRLPGVSREELVAHWYANHMGGVIEGQRRQRERGGNHAFRYIVTLYGANAAGEHPWDGMAQLWFNEPLPIPDEPYGRPPRDTFQQKTEPYLPWTTTEYVVMDGALPVEPLTLNAPFPCTRSGFFKVSFLVPAKPDTDYDAFFSHWLTVHVPNVRSVMEQVGGFRYVVSHSVAPATQPFAGLAELYFPDESGWQGYRQTIKADGMEAWVDTERMKILRSDTEMVGIP